MTQDKLPTGININKKLTNKPFRAVIKRHYRKIILGHYTTLEEAINIRTLAETYIDEIDKEDILNMKPKDLLNKMASLKKK